MKSLSTEPIRLQLCVHVLRVTISFSNGEVSNLKLGSDFASNKGRE